MMSKRVLIHASEVLTCAGVRAKDGRRVSEEDLGRIPDGAVVYSCRRVGRTEIPGRIEWVGPTNDLPRKYAKLSRRNLKNGQAIVPGLIDCHTHLVFAGDRSEEFAMRCGGATYAEIAAAGGGIMSTVRATRAASPAELEELAVKRVREAMAFGIRTIEVKSGYGLSFESEIKCLEVVKRLRKKFPQMTFFSTFLGAHAFPPEMDREKYVTELCERMIPAVAKQRLADACDVFVDEGYFSVEQGRRILEAGRANGMQLKMHADELANLEAAALASDLNALSADHLLRVSDDGISRLAESRTVAVLLPGTAFYLKAQHAPARKLIDSGAAVALSTDFNPGTCVTLHLPAVMTIAALYLGMTRSEILAAVTYNAARALNLHERKGSIEPGRDADLSILPFRRFEEMYYRFAWCPAVS